MSLSIGIVGLPNVGKSTLFNALLKQQAALAANYPFATIDRFAHSPRWLMVEFKRCLDRIWMGGIILPPHFCCRFYLERELYAQPSS